MSFFSCAPFGGIPAKIRAKKWKKKSTTKTSLLTSTDKKNISVHEETVIEKKEKKEKKKKRPRAPTGEFDALILKKCKTPTLKQWTQHMTLPVTLLTIPQPTVFYGIDMSLTNPGLSIVSLHQKTIHMYFFRNRKKETVGSQLITDLLSPFYQWQLTLQEMKDPEIQKTSLYRFQRYERKIQALLSIIGPYTPEKRVALEGYSYNSKPTEAETYLKELGGCLRRALCQQEHKIMELPPKTIKKIFSGTGNANKNDMYRAYRQVFHLPNLFTLMNLGEEQKYLETDKIPPHPLEDLVDALGVALSACYLTFSYVETKKGGCKSHKSHDTSHK